MTLLILVTAGLAIALGYFLWAGANTLSAEFHLTGNATLAKGLTNRTASESFQIGQNSFPAFDRTYTNGSGAQQATIYFANSYTIAGAANQDIDLTGALTDDMGQTVSNAVIKELLVAIDTPDGVMSVRVGPQGVANAWQGPFGGTVATSYETVYDVQRWTNSWNGWAVTAGTGDILRLNNPGGTAITVHVVILGA